MSTLRDLYLRVAAAIADTHPSTKAEVDAAFAEHEAAQGEAPAPLAVVPAVDLGDAP